MGSIDVTMLLLSRLFHLKFACHHCVYSVQAPPGTVRSTDGLMNALYCYTWDTDRLINFCLVYTSPQISASPSSWLSLTTHLKGISDTQVFALLLILQMFRLNLGSKHFVYLTEENGKASPAFGWVFVCIASAIL